MGLSQALIIYGPLFLGGGGYVLTIHKDFLGRIVITLGFQTPGEEVFGPQKHTSNTFSGGIWKTRVIVYPVKLWGQGPSFPI